MTTAHARAGAQTKIDDRFWLTPAGCEALGSHRIHDDGGCRTCTICGADVDRDEPTKDYCPNTRDDAYGDGMACLLFEGHAEGCWFTRYAALPAGHPRRAPEAVSS